MAVRLACPACGRAFTPNPADAGRVVPCAGCGSDLEMPAAVPPAKRRRAEPPDEDERPARARGASLLWLWVLLGSGAVGLFAGASVFYFVVREQPPAARPVAEKPKTEPPVEKERPKTDPPKVEPPKTDPPKVDAPKVDPPKIEAPKLPPVPRVPGVPGVPGAVVAANTIPGLKFYLPCDAVVDGKVIEAVSGKPVGTGFGLAITDGPRGDALRLTHDRKDTDRNRHALDLTDARDRLTIPANRPFTLAFWTRRVHTDTNSGFGAYLFDARTDHNAPHARALYLQLLPAVPALAAASLLDMPNRADQASARSAAPSFRVADPAAWTHIALVRGADGTVQLLVNGAAEPGARRFPFPGELRYDTIGLLFSAEGKTVIDLDELCLFDRALTGAELGALSGTKVEAPKPPPVVEVKVPKPGEVPAATEFRGLKFYLPCEAIDGETLAEAVSGKNVGKGRKFVSIDGPRGKAVRATAAGPGQPREGFDLSAHAEALAIDEGKPFTLALWVRTDDWESVGGRFVDGRFSANDKFLTFSLYRYQRGFGFLLQQGKPGGGADAGNQLARATRETPPTKQWVHLALTRDEKGTVRLAIDGAGAVTAPGPYTAPLRFTNFSLVWQQGNTFTADFDEFCLFDRVLTDDELARLGGKKGKGAVAGGPKEKPPAVERKDPPVVPKEPLALAPPPRVVGVEPPVAPKEPVVPPAVAVSAPVGVDPKGLLLYLPFEEEKNGQVREGVSGKFAGKCDGAELVKGPRGTAVRLSAERPDGAAGTCKLDFSDLADRTAVAEGKPFTFALWLRVEAREPGTKTSGTAVQFGARPDRDYDRALQIGFGAAGTLHCTARASPDRLDAKRETAARWTGVGNPAKWQHLAMARDEKNAVRWYLNGKVVPLPGKPDPVWAGPLGFDRLLVGDPEQTKLVLEVDELCLFDRALTADELKKLAEPIK